MLPVSLKTLIDQLSKLPGLGQRSATRLAFYLLGRPTDELNALAQAIKELPVKIKHCQRCFNLTSDGPLRQGEGEASDLCAICANKTRQQNLICVVEDILDIIPIERTRQFTGVYHVLGGLISPIDGLTPDKLRVKELVLRVKQYQAQNSNPPAPLSVRGDKIPPTPLSKGGAATGGLNPPIEIIFALNPTAEGDTTALYLEKILAPLGAKTTKLNRGLSTGSDLEYADETTLINALKYRH